MTFEIKRITEECISERYTKYNNLRDQKCIIYSQCQIIKKKNCFPMTYNFLTYI